MADKEQQVIDELFRTGSDYKIFGQYDAAEKQFRAILEKRPLRKERGPADDATNVWAAQELHDIEMLKGICLDYGAMAIMAGLYSK